MTPKEAAEQMQKIVIALAKEVDGAEVAALQNGLGLYLGRIFNDGKASDGSSMGKYSISHAKKRSTPRSAKKVRQVQSGPNKGKQIPSAKTLETYPISALQTQYKDLQFFGDLFKNIDVGTSNGNNVIGFLRTIDRLKVQGTEDYIGKDVAALTDEEKAEIDATYRAAIDEIITNALGQ
jgi:hypothetical protein